jgi:small subunit ribosomal protein S17
MTTSEGTARNRRQTATGVVVSDKMQKTVVVEITNLVRHPGYDKRVRRRTRVKAHDEENACRQGDRVRVMETRPVSKDKRWRIIEILERAL